MENGFTYTKNGAYILCYNAADQVFILPIQAKLYV